MIIARTRLRSPARGSAVLTMNILCDLLWLHAQPKDRIEHMRVRADPPDGVEITWFVIPQQVGPTSSGHTAQAIAERVCRLAIQGSPALAGWEIT